MASDRSYILDRLKSKSTTIEDFNFETLAAPPLYMFLSPYDVEELRNIATSVRLSGKSKERLNRIDEVMKRRGLVKLGAGTNRVVYRHPEFPSIVFKVALDAVGMNDNPAEFRNQWFLKPFVAKMFEVSPCGTVSVVERVKPIINREEYVSVADDVFELINTWIIGKYIMADIGTKFFMNIGVREGFGVVLLDYPYLYELDGNKLFCQLPAKDSNNPSEICDGVIDYDAGYNHLYCTKCGAMYKARELARDIIDNKVIVKQGGKEVMKIKISGGTHNVNKVITNGVATDVENITNTNMVKSTPTAPKAKSPVVNNTDPVKKIEKAVNGKGVKVGSKEHVETSAIKEAQEKYTEMAEKITERKIIAEYDENGSHIQEYNTGECVVMTPVPVDDIQPIVNTAQITLASPKKEVISPFTFNEDVKAEPISNESPVYNVELAMKKVIENLDKIQIDDVKNDLIERIFSNIIASDVDKLAFFKLLIKMITNLFDNINDGDIAEEALKDSTVINEFIARYYTVLLDMDQKDDKVIATASVGLIWDDEEDLPDRYKFNTVQKDITIDVPKEDSSKDGQEIDKVTFYNSKILKVKEAFPVHPDNVKGDTEVIVPMDKNDNFVLDKDGAAIMINTFDYVKIKDISIVNKEWLDSTKSIVDNNCTEAETYVNEEESNEQIPIDGKDISY